MPLVSVITVVRNASEMLRKTILNVCEQTMEDLEYVVVDGASTDNTVQVIKENQQVIEKWVSEPDKGIYDAMNKGVRMASGQWVIFMNAGDIFASPDVLEKIFEEKPVEDVIYGDVVKHDDRGLSYIKKAEPVHNAHRMFFCHQSSLVKRELLLQYPFDIRHKMSADFKFFKQMVLMKRTFRKYEGPVSEFDTTGVSNALRSKGLADNISVIREVDNCWNQIKLLPRLYFTYVFCIFKQRKNKK